MTKTTESEAHPVLTPQAILARLRNVARTYTNVPPNLMLLLYAQQGLLGRLDASPYADHFVLKGGLSLFVRYRQQSRPTQDIDLAASGTSHDPTQLEQVIRQICALPLGDGLIFDPTSIKADAIHEGATYSGVRVSLLARLGGSQQRLQIDVSFGNQITPGPEDASFPAILLDEAVHLRIYPLETVISEKFAALVEINLATTRMKDLHDLLVISEREAISASTLSHALQRSFAARKTPQAGISPVLNPSFATDEGLTKRWNGYRGVTRWANLPDFGDVMTRLQGFVGPVVLGRRSAGEWDPRANRWS
ncbi:nucleotidyl transferase AbiEii/AbiGii toxin family protein [Deinococcus sp. Arct2-2]|uniref:nucleotidyl transferase AbiEii/AbiGii toxin family protein n=1 Tax=Deinococcus sp. Arct2-2 TaxID=2568653 RepID=UPI0010A3B77E|nr:nucleotidyl transferase AbiEii/AbiGii toxin family protein [Deinococcus sp. Arct2-2]THF68021.1 nucleotidyl transferase AbiEii/AbiGii toxin family protein [Deinococcus sp. Arct2-2]